MKKNDALQLPELPADFAAGLEAMQRACKSMQGSAPIPKNTASSESSADVPCRSDQHSPQTPEGAASNVEDSAGSGDDNPGDGKHGFLCRTLAELPPRTVLDTGALSNALGVDARTIKRMVERGELPPPTTWAGRNCWTAGKILDFFERRLERAEREAERRAKSHRVV